MSASYPKQHRAAYSEKQGAHVKVQDVPTPQLNAKENEVLIKITATAINPVDWKMRDYNVLVEKWPLIMGSDAAGEIVATAGDKAEAKFKKGDRVFFQGMLGRYDSCTFQEYAVMAADLVAHTPDSITDDEAAGVSLASIAVIVGFYNDSGFKISPAPWEQGGSSVTSSSKALPGKGKAIVILGGSSSVGQYAIQLARLSGFQTIVTGSSAAHHDHLVELGATKVLDRHDATPEAYAKAAAADGHAFVYLFDCIGGSDTMQLGIDVLKAAGQSTREAVKSVGLSKPTVVTVYNVDEKVQKAADAADIEIKVVWGIGSAPYLRPQTGPYMDALGGPKGWLANKHFVPNRPHVIKGGLANLEEALEKNRAGISGRKVVIHPTEG